MTAYLRTDDILIPQGATFAVYWPLFAADGITPLVTTGWTARAQARATIASSTVLVSWTTENAGLAYSTVGVESRLTLYVTAAASSAFIWLKAYYDIELVNTAGEVLRLTQGTIRVDREVTR